MRDSTTGNYWSGSNKETNHEELSVEETLERTDLELEDIANPFSHRASQPACCECLSYIEPDGKCPHGNPSVLRKKGLV